MTTTFQPSKYKNKLIFLPLGGAGEIGMNLNLYHLNGRWIIVDLGLGFADIDLPGSSIIVPNINFILQKIVDKIDAIIITHAHEDHIGAIPYLWPEIKCPIYTTKFTALIIKKKISEHRTCDNLKIIEVEPRINYNIKDFNIELIPMHHSIPEMHALFIQTTLGNIFHTGDWRFANSVHADQDDNISCLKKIGKKNILALVGDSTNVFNQEPARSEHELGLNIAQVINKHEKNLIIITTFASNVNRLRSIFAAAKKSKRKVFMLGRSLWRIFNAAQNAGYLLDAEVISEKNIKNFSKNEVLIICTGCQGEEAAALNKIARNQHPDIKASRNDLVIFSSKIIPGNDKKIYKMYNLLTKAGIKILHEHNEFVHVSGHPSKKEVQQIYNYIQPQIAIPVHGESFHLHEHCRIAKEAKIPNVLQIANGDVVAIDKNSPNILANVENGRYAVDGNVLYEDDHKIFTQRRIMMNNGIFLLDIILKDTRLHKINLSAPGLLDNEEDADLLQSIHEDIKMHLGKYLKKDKQIINSLQKFLRKRIRKDLNKFPLITINLYNV